MTWKLRWNFVWIPLGAVAWSLGVAGTAIANPILSEVVTAAAWMFLIPAAFSLSLAIVKVLEYGLYGVCLVIIVPAVEGAAVIDRAIDRVIDEYGWDVANLLADMREWVTTQTTSEPTALEQVKDDYARGELSDLEMEEEIAAAIQEDGQ